jgi:hypothetical protein
MDYFVDDVVIQFCIHDRGAKIFLQYCRLFEVNIDRVSIGNWIY